MDKDPKKRPSATEILKMPYLKEQIEVSTYSSLYFN